MCQITVRVLGGTLTARVSFAALAAAVLLMAGACAVDDGAASRCLGSLELSLSNDAIFVARTIEPALDMSIASYDVRGAGPNGATFEQLGLAGQATTQASLVPGQWTVSVDGRNAQGTVIGAGSGSAQIVAGEITSLTIVIRPIQGNGTLDVTIRWPSGVLSQPWVVASLTPAMENPYSITFSLGGDKLSATYINTRVHSGYYTFVCQLYDGRDVVWGTVEAVRIVAGWTSSRVYELVADVNRGGLEINLVEEMQNPISITLNVPDTFTLHVGQTVLVAATTSEPVDSYQWYLRGVLLGGESRSFVTVGGGLGAGTYWLDLVVTAGDVLSSRGVVFEVLP